MTFGQIVGFQRAAINSRKEELIELLNMSTVATRADKNKHKEYLRALEK